jgi:PAS domain S-box-containing protein
MVGTVGGDQPTRELPDAPAAPTGDEAALVDALRWRNRQQEIMADLGRAALVTADDRSLLDVAVAAAAEGLATPLAAILERKGDSLTMLTGVGWDPKRLGPRKRAVEEVALAAFALQQDRAVVAEDVRSDPRFAYTPVLREHGVVSAVNVLIRAPGRPAGVLGAYTTSPRAFSEDDVTFLSGVANVIGSALWRAAVERELRERELEARLAFAAGRMGSWYWDVASAQVRWSPEMEDVYGLGTGEFPGTLDAYLELVHPDDRQAVLDVLAAAQRDEGEFSMQHRIVRPDGTVRVLEGRGRPVRDETGAIDRWIGVGIDVTERAETEAELRGRELETRLAFAAGRMGSWRWSSATGRGTWSPELEDLVGVERDTFDGSWDSFIGPIHAADGPMLRDTIGQAVASRSEFAVQYRVRRTDGGLRWVESRGAPIDDGREWVGVTIDVTEVRGALDALRRSRGELEETVARLDGLVDHAPVGFAFFDRDLRFVRLNGPLAAMNGIPAADHLGRTVEELLPGLWPALQPVLQRVLATGRAEPDVEVHGQTPARPGVDRYWLASYYPVPSSDGTPLGIGAVMVEITERKRREREARLTAQAGELFVNAEADLAETLQQAAELVVPDLADSCFVGLVARPEEPARSAVAHVDPGIAARMRTAEARWPLDVAGLVGDRVEPLLVPEVTPDQWYGAADHEQVRELATDHAAKSVILAPLRAAGELLGALVLATTPLSGRVYQPGDVPFVHQLADRLALAIRNAYLAQEARRAQGRLDVLAEIGELLVVDLDSEARLSAFTEVVVPTFADVCRVHLEERGVLRPVAHAGPGAEPHEAELPVDGPSPEAEAYRTGSAILQSAVQPAGGGHVPAGERSRLLVPLSDGDQLLGVITFACSASGRSYGRRDVALGEEIARRMAPALQNALRFEREAATAEALQRSLLPERLPELGGTRLAARYVPSGAGVRIGGDWYDAIPLPDGRVVLAIGDVVGHGVRAAAAMGRLRSVLQFCALDGLDPGATLQRLNAYLAALAGPDMATLLVVEHVPATGGLRYASAGHLPPLLVLPGGGHRFLDDAGGVPLGAGDASRYSVATAAIPPGSLLVLYTDGLVERRGESLDSGLARLASIVEESPDDLEQLADGLLAELLAPGDSSGPTDDDVALLLLRTLAPGERLDLRLDAAPRELQRLRRLVGDWLTRSGASPQEVAELTVVVNELAANAIEHAYGLVDAEFLLRGRVSGGAVEVEVQDFGRWRRRTPRGDRGRGLRLARGLVDDLEVVPSGGGTIVRARRRLAVATDQDGGPSPAAANPDPTR